MDKPVTLIKIAVTALTISGILGLIALILMIVMGTASGQTHTMPGANVVPGGASLTIQSGGTFTAATGSTATAASVKLTAVAVASLPGSPSIGQIAAVSDGTASLAWGATVTGGGSTKYLVWYNGTNWTVSGK